MTADMPRTRIATLDRSRLCDRVATVLRRLVVQGVYPPGSRLPSAQALALELGVTRLTVREALAQLGATGLTQTRHGSGTYVVDAAATATLQTLSEALSAGRDLTREEIESLLEFRAVVIMGFVDVLARSCSPEDADRLQAIVQAGWDELGRPGELARLDYRFNEALALASRNLFYTLLIRSVARAHVALGEIVFRNCGDGSIVLKTHEGIIRALRKGDAAAVRRRLAAYIEGGNRIVAAWPQKKEGEA